MLFIVWAENIKDYLYPIDSEPPLVCIGDTISSNDLKKIAIPLPQYAPISSLFKILCSNRYSVPIIIAASGVDYLKVDGFFHPLFFITSAIRSIADLNLWKFPQHAPYAFLKDLLFACADALEKNRPMELSDFERVKQNQIKYFPSFASLAVMVAWATLLNDYYPHVIRSIFVFCDSLGDINGMENSLDQIDLEYRFRANLFNDNTFFNTHEALLGSLQVLRYPRIHENVSALRYFDE